MAITKRTVVQNITIHSDGRMDVFEVTEYWEGGFIAGTLETISPRRGRTVDVGDDVTTEDDLIKDTASGVHTVQRISDRDIAKVEEAAKL